VEARHASKIRRIRRARPGADTPALRFSGYVRGGGFAAAGAGNISNPPAAVVTALNAIYGGATPESNTTHVLYNDVSQIAVTLDAATMPMPGVTVLGVGETQGAAAAMAFDEALTKEEVTEIIKGFIKDDTTRGLP
jgi:hypothetical protein